MTRSEQRLRFDDLRVGMVRSAGETYEMTAGEIVEVAGRWDPQVFHLDAEAARTTDYGGLIASGLHTFAASICLGERETPPVASVAGLGIDELRFLQPVRPGDRLAQTTEILELRPSRSRPDRGIVRGRRTLTTEAGVAVLTYVLTWMVERAVPGGG